MPCSVSRLPQGQTDRQPCGEIVSAALPVSGPRAQCSVPRAHVRYLISSPSGPVGDAVTLVCLFWGREQAQRSRGTFLRPQMIRSSRAAPVSSVYDRLACRFCAADVAGAGVLRPGGPRCLACSVTHARGVRAAAFDRQQHDMAGDHGLCVQGQNLVKLEQLVSFLGVFEGT